jgi:hypothetical protein
VVFDIKRDAIRRRTLNKFEERRSKNLEKRFKVNVIRNNKINAATRI